MAVIVLAVVVALAGGTRHGRHVRAAELTTATAVTPTVAVIAKPHLRASPTRRRPPNPPRGVPTRLVGGPLVFRVSGGRVPNPYNDTPRLRYVLIYRLNRPRLRLPKNPHDREGPTPLPAGARTSLGNISLADLQFYYDYCWCFSSNPESGADQDNCFISEVRGDVPATVRLLDEIPLGGRVRVRIRPLTPKPGGGARLGPAYLRHPRLLPMRAKRDDAHLLYDQVASPGALRQLHRIGCSATFLS